MTDAFAFAIHGRDGAARVGEISMPRGTIRTPAFMPVGTAATVKAMYPGEVRALGADIVLGNTYHLMLRPGAERIAALGGLHKFMNWPHPILTDSGGFQVMSLAKLRKISERGVVFQSHIDGARHELTPERSMEIQRLLGSDIQMQLDECVRLPCSDEEAERAMRLSLRWAERSKAGVRRPAGQGGFRHRSGRRGQGLARDQRAGTRGDGFSRLCDRRPGGRRAAGDDARDDRDRRAASAGRQAALSDGGRNARRSPAERRARRRHVRLRDADARRAPRHGLFALRTHQSAQCAPRRRCQPDRSAIDLRRRRAIIRAPIGIIWSSQAKFSR